MHTRFVQMLLAVLAIMLAVGCGSGSGDDGSTIVADDVESAQPPATDAPETTTTGPPSTSSTTKLADPDDRDVGSVSSLLADAETCEARLPVGEHELAIEFAGDQIPVIVQVDEAAAAKDSPALVIDFHVGGAAAIMALDPQVASPRTGGAIFVQPRAGATTSSFWSRNATFNTDYVNALWAAVSTGLCFDESRTLWAGIGQGHLLVLDAICNTTHPVGAAYLVFGMNIRKDCSGGAARPVPIVSVDPLISLPDVPMAWDSGWVPPVPLEAEQYNFGPTLESLDLWAELYDCADERTEETVALDDAPQAVLRSASYTDCAASLKTFGFGSDVFTESPNDIAALLGDELAAAIDKS